LTRFQLDLDLDGKPELLVAAEETTGNAGGPHLVFARGADGLHYRGTLFVHPKAIRVLPAVGTAPVRIMTYIRLGPAEGLLRTTIHDRLGFVTVAEERIEPTGKDKQRYDTLFMSPDAP
jgi:hypothetical protein